MGVFTKLKQLNKDKLQDSSPVLRTDTAPDAPPSYSAATEDPASNPVEDPYSFLTTFDTIFLIDDSGSMTGSRWQEARSALASIVPICTAHDTDGIDIYFLNTPSSPRHKHLKSATQVQSLFEDIVPNGGTPTGQRLDAILKPYLKEYKIRPRTTKPVNIIVVTDGRPTDDLESPIIAAAKKLDKLDAAAWQVGIQFFQVGKDPDATAHLKQLDDELDEIAKDELRDMVDTVPVVGANGAELSAEGILKVVLGAVNRRLDRKTSLELYGW